MHQLLIALRYYSTGSVQRLIADGVICHQSTASRAIHKVSLAIKRRLHNYVHFPPERQEHLKMMDKFYEISQFPQVVGCVDGPHIHITAPSQNEQEYVNRKGYHSLNIQLICDGNQKITNCVIKWPGSTHDARILTTSAIYQRFEEHTITGFILGDNAYPPKHWLMTPVLNPITETEERYNRSFLPTRCCIERTIGVLKRRWFCLHQELRLTPERAATVTAACLVLHNICIMKRLPLPEGDDRVVIEDYVVQDQVMEADISGRMARARIIERCFTDN